MSLPINRSSKATLDTNLVNGITSDAPVVKASNDVVYNTIDELYNYALSLVTSGTLSPLPPEFMGRQAIINGNFDVAQRGTSFTNPASLAYLLDHWQTYNSVTTPPTTIVHSQQTLAGDIPGSLFFDRVNWNGTGVAPLVNEFYAKWQKIENGVSYLCGAGKKVTVSFMARSNISGKRLGVGLRQDYGSAGSPSAVEDLSTTGQAITLNSTWTKYTVTFTTNTLVGKSFGANRDDNLRLAFFYMWGTNIGSANVGGAATESFVTAGNIDIAQVQVCAGDVVLPFQPRSFADELRLCQRYCQILKGANLKTPLSSLAVPTDIIISIPLKVSMRVPPTMTMTGVRGTDWALATITAVAVTTGTLAAYPTGNDFGSIYFNGGTFTSGTPHYVTLITTSGSIVMDAEI